MIGLTEKFHLQRKNSIKSLSIMSWNVLDAFVLSLLVFTMSFTLGVNKIKQLKRSLN